MTGRLLAFSCRLYSEGTSLSVAEINERCMAIERQLRVLIPGLQSLRSSRLTYQLSLQPGGLMVNFELESLRQRRLPLGQRNEKLDESDHAALWDDFRMLMNSLQGTKAEMSVIVRDPSPAGYSTAGRKQSDHRLRKLMKDNKGRTLRYDTAQGVLEIDIPESLPFLVSPTSSMIRCKILSVNDVGVIVHSVSLTGTSQPTVRLGSRKQLLVEFPHGENPYALAKRLLPFVFDKKSSDMKVHVCTEPLLGSITHFLMCRESQDARR